MHLRHHFSDPDQMFCPGHATEEYDQDKCNAYHGEDWYDIKLLANNQIQG
mgnify:CR=1 FL=1